MGTHAKERTRVLNSSAFAAGLVGPYLEWRAASTKREVRRPKAEMRRNGQPVC